MKLYTYVTGAGRVFGRSIFADDILLTESEYKKRIIEKPITDEILTVYFTSLPDEIILNDTVTAGDDKRDLFYEYVIDTSSLDLEHFLIYDECTGDTVKVNMKNYDKYNDRLWDEMDKRNHSGTDIKVFEREGSKLTHAKPYHDRFNKDKLTLPHASISSKHVYFIYSSKNRRVIKPNLATESLPPLMTKW